MPTSDTATGRSVHPSRRSLREPGPRRTATGSVRVPVAEHVPVTTVSPASPKSPRVPLRRRLAGLVAAASACGLALALALPVTQQAGQASPGAGAVLDSQRLFSETSLEEMPSSLTEISAADAEVASSGDYAFDPSVLVNYPFDTTVTLTDGFAYRTAPVEQFHDAQDFAAAPGTPIRAIADGTVLEAGWASDGCGFSLKLGHEIDGADVTSRYCHMQADSHSLAVGDTVRMGDQVGAVGNTGMSFGPHLHLALRVDDKPADPMPFIAEYNRKKRTAGSSSTSEPATPAAPAVPASEPPPRTA
ncbi:M23 family metallopeptidase [Leucobacter sp. wl10]|uniref:M23 family metallopeptidase n=1 Tax=Leucobacter sp. wl10 TaxID=2304677 RepID=UPI000E5B7CAE|nr:M23 family metallopeptidase [Leucobacter sp. wl10]RGE18050.1 M23 family peptidase [Leucobacter sp. wl10]